VPVTISIGGSDFQAGLRTTPRQKIVYVAADLQDSTGKAARLADVLRRNGFRRNDRVVLKAHGNAILLSRAE
jgi:hypothetical protein